MRAGLALAVLALAACRAQPTPEPAGPGATTSASAATTSAAPAASSSTAARPAPRRALLDSQGVAIGQGTGTADRFAFGTPRAAVEAAANRWLGAGERSSIGECGAGPMDFTRYGGLTLNYLDGKFVGWFAKEGPSAVTSDGIRPGARMRDLHVTRSVKMIPDSTLDGEFEYLAADGTAIGGFARGKGSDAKVESLYAGMNCFFR